MGVDLRKLWLAVRVPLSNWKNRFDPLDGDALPWWTVYTQEAIPIVYENDYTYRYDIGDWIPTPRSAYNRAYLGKLEDDCDGFAALVYYILEQENKQPHLLTYVPRKFWRGHTVCYGYENFAYFVWDYDVKSPPLRYVSDVKAWVLARQGEKDEDVVWSENVFVDGRWK